jgi:hypothetical protein
MGLAIPQMKIDDRFLVKVFGLLDGTPLETVIDNVAFLKADSHLNAEHRPIGYRGWY